MIVGIGTDIIDVERISKNIKNNKFLLKIYTDKEIEYMKERKMNPQTAAGMFSAKEAVAKCLGTGFVSFGPKDIEVIRDKMGKPYVVLYNNAKKISNENKIDNIHLSISHIEDYAVAYAVAESLLYEVNSPLP